MRTSRFACTFSPDPSSNLEAVPYEPEGTGREGTDGLEAEGMKTLTRLGVIKAECVLAPGHTSRGSPVGCLEYFLLLAFIRRGTDPAVAMQDWSGPFSLSTTDDEGTKKVWGRFGRVRRFI